MCGTMYGMTLDMLNHSLSIFQIMSKSLLAVMGNHK